MNESHPVYEEMSFQTQSRFLHAGSFLFEFLPSCIPALCLLLLLSCRVEDHTPPTAVISVKPDIGDSLTVFYLNADDSRDDLAEPWQLKVRWDVDSDRRWETDFSLEKDYAWRFPRNGRYTVTCEVMDGGGNRTSVNQDVLVMPVMRDSIFVDTRNSETYRSVFLFGLWWLAENLRYGKAVEDQDVPRDDGVAEYYFRTVPFDYGGFYLWNEVDWYGRNPGQGICPDGWRLPRPTDIIALQEIIYFKKTTGDYLLAGGRLGTDLTLSGRYIRLVGRWEGQTNRSSFWVSDTTRPTRFRTWALYRAAYDEEGLNLVYEGDWRTPGIEGWPAEWGPFSYTHVALPVRCVKEGK